MTRRPRVTANREGRIWLRADGRFCARVYPPDGGKVRYVYGRTKEDAREKRDELERDLAEGLPTGKDVVLAAYLERWLTVTLPAEVAARNLAQSTLTSYTDNVRKHIIPDLGGVLLRRLTVSRVKQWQHGLTRKPSGRPRRKLRPGEKGLPPPSTLSLRTVAYCHAILRRALEDAVRDELVKTNVARKVKAPSVEEPEWADLTVEETAALLDASEADRLWCYWLVILILGLRRGEGLGLRWADIDFDARTIRLAHSIQRVRRADGTGELVLKNLKTKASHALIPAGEGLLAALRQHQADQKKARMQAKAWGDAGLVFTTSVGTALEPRNINRAWEAVCDRAGVRRVRVHDLRHAWGAYQSALGTHQKVIQAGLRHKRFATTERYMHAMDEPLREAADKMDALVMGLRPARRRSS